MAIKGLTAWSELKEEEITHCVKCGKKIWKFWHKDMVEKISCAPCYFK